MRATTRMFRDQRMGSIALIMLVIVASLLSGIYASLDIKRMAIVLGALCCLAIVGLRPKWGFLFLLVAIPLLSGLPRGDWVPLLKPHEVVLVLVFLSSIARRLLSRRSGIQFTAIDVTFLLWAFWSSVLSPVVLYFQGRNLSLADLSYMLAPVGNYLLYRLAIDSFSTKADVRIWLRWILIASVLVSIIGILQTAGVLGVREFIDRYFYESDLRRPIPGYPIEGRFLMGIFGNNAGRAYSTFAHNNTFGGYLAVVIVLIVTAYASGIQVADRRLVALAISIDVIGMILSGSLAAIGSMFIVLGALFLNSKESRKILPLVMGSVIVAGVLFWPFLEARLSTQFGRGYGIVPASLATRIEVWARMLPTALDNFWLGLGPSTPTDYFWYSGGEESYYIKLLLRGGALNLFLYLLFLGVVFKIGHSAASFDGPELLRKLGVMLLLVTSLIVLMNVTQMAFVYRGVADVFWVLLGLVVAAGNLKKVDGDGVGGI